MSKRQLAFMCGFLSLVSTLNVYQSYYWKDQAEQAARGYHRGYRDGLQFAIDVLQSTDVKPDTSHLLTVVGR